MEIIRSTKETNIYFFCYRTQMMNKLHITQHQNQHMRGGNTNSGGGGSGTTGNTGTNNITTSNNSGGINDGGRLTSGNGITRSIERTSSAGCKNGNFQ